MRVHLLLDVLLASWMDVVSESWTAALLATGSDVVLATWMDAVLESWTAALLATWMAEML